MQILKMWLYHERIVFLTKLGDKYQLFYKSSGLAGYDSKGMVMPICRLKDTVETSPDGLGEWMSFGWLPKSYVYNGRFQAYRSKQRNEFPEHMHPYLDILENIDTSGAELQPDPREINAYCAQYIDTYKDYVDWKSE